jgi:hypothetical protein
VSAPCSFGEPPPGPGCASACRPGRLRSRHTPRSPRPAGASTTPRCSSSTNSTSPTATRPAATRCCSATCSTDAPPGALHRLDVTAERLDRECTRYCTLIGDGGLGLTLLGIGTNGHLGLNEPGSPIDGTCRVVDLHPATAQRVGDYGGGAAPRRGATIGIAEILASHEVWLLATGRHKAEILRAALRGPVGPEVPASYLQTHPNTIVFADTEAASLL